MKNCSQCLLYDKDYDEMRRDYNDVIIEGRDTDKEHFCVLHTPIDKDVWNGVSRCEDFTQK